MMMAEFTEGGRVERESCVEEEIQAELGVGSGEGGGALTTPPPLLLLVVPERERHQKN